MKILRVGFWEDQRGILANGNQVREREGAFSEWNQVGKQAEGGLLVNGTEKFLKKSSM